MAYKTYHQDTFETGGIDYLTVLLYLMMVLAGWISVYSASYDASSTSIFDTNHNAGRQLVFIGISILLGGALLLLDAKFYNAFGYLIYAVAIFLCIAVIFAGNETKGAKAWFAIGSFKFQPVELAKYGTALSLAKYLGTYEVSFKNLKTKIVCIALWLAPMILVLLQNDTGSALVFIAFFLVLYREGLNGWILFLIALGGLLMILALLVHNKLIIVISLAIVSLLLAFLFRKNIKVVLLIFTTVLLGIGLVYAVDYLFFEILQDHQRERIDVLFGRGGDDWNVRQSKIAIGSGGFFGQGFGNGSQTKYNFVPEQFTDFIFCTVGEEFGFIGAGGLVIAFVFLMIRIVIIAERQKNKFSRVFAYSVACIFFVHFSINIGMTIGLVPVIGIPLPFFSYGGSSILGFTLLLFTMLRLDANRVNEMQSMQE